MSRPTVTRTIAISAAAAFACLPLFPSFILLTPASVPGISLVPPTLALVLLTVMGVLGIVGATLMFFAERVEQPMLLPLALWLAAALLAALLGFAPLYGFIFLGIFLLGIVWHVGVNMSYGEPGNPSIMFGALLAST